MGSFLAVSGTLVAAQPAQAAGFIWTATAYKDPNFGGASHAMFVGGPCDAFGWSWYLPQNLTDYAHSVSSIYLVGNSQCDGIRIYMNTDHSRYWTCPGATCAGKIINIAAPFDNNIWKIRVFHVEGIVP